MPPHGTALSLAVESAHENVVRRLAIVLRRSPRTIISNGARAVKQPMLCSAAANNTCCHIVRTAMLNVDVTQMYRRSHSVKPIRLSSIVGVKRVTTCRASRFTVPETSVYGLRFDRSQQERIMRNAFLTAAALATLSAAAVAEQANINGPQFTPAPDSSPVLAGEPITPQHLSAHQVREIQQALQTRGLGSNRVDGQWGPDIEAALRDFQKSENMISQNGEIDPLTLLALGLDPLGYSLSGTSETTGQGDTARRHEAPDQRTSVKEKHR
jgi:Putative peptidoglycan binding domain